MKPGDLVRFIPDSDSGMFYLGIHGEGGIAIPTDSVGVIFKVHRKNKHDERTVDVLVNGIMGWCFVEDVERMD